MGQGASLAQLAAGLHRRPQPQVLRLALHAARDGGMPGMPFWAAASLGFQTLNLLGAAGEPEGQVY